MERAVMAFILFWAVLFAVLAFVAWWLCVPSMPLPLQYHGNVTVNVTFTVPVTPFPF